MPHVSNFVKNLGPKAARSALSIVLILILSSIAWLTILKSSNSSWQSFGNSYIDYNFRADKPLHHFIVRKGKGSYLVAGETPTDLSLGLNFTKSSVVRLRISSEYPSWLCSSEGLGKAQLRLKSKNVETSIALEQAMQRELILKVFESQVLEIAVTNRTQNGCGRADLIIETPPDFASLILAFMLYWIAIGLLFWRCRESIAVFTIGVLLNLLSLKAMAGLAALSPQTLFLGLGLSTIMLAVMLWMARLKTTLLRAGLFALVLGGFSWFFCAFIVYQSQTGLPISEDAIHAILQTHPSEAWDYFKSQFNIYWQFTVTITPLLIGFFVGWHGRIAGAEPSLMLVPVLICLGIVLSLINRFESPMVQLIDRAYSSYNFELELFKKLKSLRQTEIESIAAEAFNSEDNNHPNTTVVVIGESANRDHMGIYGYVRNTTPIAQELVNSGEMLKFDFAYSNHTHTNPSLSLALTRADQYKPERWMTAPSLINVARSAGIETHWITNQQLLGSWDSHASLIAMEADSLISKNKLIGRARDAVLTDEMVVGDLTRILKSAQKSQLVFVHLQGSHAAYCSRFPKETAIFEDAEALKKDFGHLAKSEEKIVNVGLNCYDDSIRYTDFVLGEISNMIKESEHPVTMLYFSDHSEDVIGNKAHNSSLFNFDMAEIPLLVMANKSWINTWADRWVELKNNRKKDFTNDHVFETVVGLLNLKSSDIDRRNDLSSGKYVEPSDPTSLHGKKRIREVANIAYWQRKNIADSDFQTNCKTLLPHRVNTLGKAREAIAAGACGLEIDVLLTNSESGAVFSVGHDTANLANFTLDEFLTELASHQLPKLWLDIKNLNKNNIDLALARLDQLNNRHSLKRRALVETGLYHESVSKISRAGYRLSYYLPTGAVLKVHDGSEGDKLDLAKVLIERISKMEAQHISFDLRLYPYVKSTLEASMISAQLDVSTMRYHSWFPPGLTLYTPSLMKKMKSQEYYTDPKMETILLSFVSPFYL